jgi:hypothetical protein
MISDWQVHLLEERLSALEKIHPPETTGRIIPPSHEWNELRGEVTLLLKMRAEVVVAYATLEVDGPNTRTVERLLYKALYPQPVKP